VSAGEVERATGPSAAAELESVVAASVPALHALGEEAAGLRPAPERWSKKEVLGHLIDSAANNHQRFVRLQLESPLTLPSYTQNDWVRIQRYHTRPWRELVELWAAYNRHLVHVLRGADASAAANVWHGPSGDVALSFLMGDYLRHLKHHLAQIL
jgi:hypothetical protein